MTEQFPSNANKHQPQAKREPPKKVEKIVSGEVIRRRKPAHRRVFESFVGDSVGGVWSYVLLDVLIPAAKDMVYDAMSTGFERLLFREGRHRGRRGGPPSQFGHVAYNRYSSSSRRDEPRRELSRRSRSSHDFDEIMFPTRVEAQEVIDQMYFYIDQYDAVSVAEMYEMAGVSSNFVDRRWGWTELSDTAVRRTRNGYYVLDLPKPEPLND